MHVLESVSKVLKEAGDFIVGIFRELRVFCESMNKLTQTQITANRRITVVDRRVVIGKIAGRKTGNLTAMRELNRRIKKRR